MRAQIDELIGTSRQAGATGDRLAAWRKLEDAHVLSQPWIRPHVRVHAHMLALSLRDRDAREFAGQVSRLLLAGPGSATGRYPLGNSGRSRVSAFKPMPIRDDLAELLAEVRAVDGNVEG